MTHSIEFSNKAQVSELGALLGLTQIKGLGPKTLQEILALDLAVEELWQAKPALLRTLFKGRQADLLVEAWEVAQKGFDPVKMLETYANLDIQVIAYNAPNYPSLLSQIYAPPAILYIRGNLNALIGKTLGFVGTRKCSSYGEQVVQRMIQDLVPARPHIISGLAAGVDGLAHQQALNYDLPTVAVFGCGIDQIFPKRHERLAKNILESGGALLSEYGLGVSGSKSTFPQRNRIIAGLSYGVVVVEGGVRSGSLITARYALEEGRSVFAVPGNIFSPGSQGPLKLIQDGAVLLKTPDDIFQELNWLPPKKIDSKKEKSESTDINLESEKTSVNLLGSSLSGDERQLLEAIEFEPMAIDSLPERVDFPAAKVNTLLTMLELEGLIAQLPGAKVCRT